MGIGMDMDALYAADYAGSSGRVAGIDFTLEQLEKARKARRGRRQSWVPAQAETAHPPVVGCVTSPRQPLRLPWIAPTTP